VILSINTNKILITINGNITYLTLSLKQLSINVSKKGATMNDPSIILA